MFKISLNSHPSWNPYAVNLWVVGDVHQSLFIEDIEYFNDSDIDVVLFVGDLAQHTGRGGRRLIKLLAQVKKPTFVIPEIMTAAFVTRLQQLAGHPWVNICAYSSHDGD